MRELMSEAIPIGDLVRRAGTGDRPAVEDLIAHFTPRLEGFIRSRMGHRVKLQLDAQDVAQETFAKAFLHIEAVTWEGETAFFGWLASIAENIILSATHKTRRMTLQLEHDIPGPAGSPSKDLRRNERFERLQNALEGLSPDHRQVIFLARIERLPVGEIASRMERSPNAVKKLLARALLELKKGFGDTDSLHLPDRHLSLKEVDGD
jgi:RNA polymerase sigma-70 factor, ECF subfamily